jgi:hypothetical protein
VIATTITHPKFFALQRKLGLHVYQCVGLLETLWLLAALHADDGDLSKFSASEIASFVEWQGDPDQLIEVLVELRWLDRDERGIQIHDWDQNCPAYIHDRRRKRAKRKGSSDRSDSQANRPRQSETIADNPSLSDRVQDIPGQSGKVQESRYRTEESRIEQNNQSCMHADCLHLLKEIGIESPEEHLRAALDRGKTDSDVRDLVAEYQRRQSKPSPPRPPLLACWLKGTKDWPSIKKPTAEHYHRVKTMAEVMR